MEALSRNWGWLLALGILMIILGVVAMAAPVVATIAIQVMLGWLLVISGIAEGIHAFMVKEWRGFLLELLSAVLYLGVGLLLLVDPLKGAVALTLILGVFLLVVGIFKIITALRVREHRGWGWLLASGIVSVVLGVMIWAQWPASGLWVIGLLVGIQLLFTGWSLVMLALVARGHRQAMAAP